MKYSSVFKLIIRLLSSPAMLLLTLVVFNLFAIRRWVLFIRYGGEFITYEKDESVTINDIYKKVKNLNYDGNQI